MRGIRRAFRFHGGWEMLDDCFEMREGRSGSIKMEGTLCVAPLSDSLRHSS